jgi:hypothetical protein
MTDDAQLGPDMSRHRWIWVERERDLKWLRSRLGADKDPWIQAQIAKLESEIRIDDRFILEKSIESIVV